MRYFEVSDYSAAQFQRLTGVKREVFELMVCVVREQRRFFGRPRKLSVEDQLLLSLCYWREFAASFTWRVVSESAKRRCAARSRRSRTPY